MSVCVLLFDLLTLSCGFSGRGSTSFVVRRRQSDRLELFIAFLGIWEETLVLGLYGFESGASGPDVFLFLFLYFFGPM